MIERSRVVPLALLLIAVMRPTFCPAQTNAAAASISSAPGSRVLPPSPSYRFPDGEKFVYSVQWHMLNAGTATILMQRSASGEHLTSTADSAGLANKIFPVHDIFEADLNPHTFCTSQISKHNEEGQRRLQRRIYFDYPQSKSEVDDHDLKTGKAKRAEFDIPPCVADVVTGFFYVSSFRLEPGFSQIFPVNDGGKTTDVRIEVETRERIKGPTGEFQTLRVKAEPLSATMKGVLWVWFTDDGRHVPVQMRSKLGFATLLFQLQRIETLTAQR